MTCDHFGFAQCPRPAMWRVESYWGQYVFCDQHVPPPSRRARDEAEARACPFVAVVAPLVSASVVDGA